MLIELSKGLLVKLLVSWLVNFVFGPHPWDSAICLLTWTVKAFLYYCELIRGINIFESTVKVNHIDTLRKTIWLFGWVYANDPNILVNMDFILCSWNVIVIYWQHARVKIKNKSSCLQFIKFFFFGTNNL